MTFFFDQKGDALDISFGEPRKAVYKELKNDIAIRVDPESGEIVGLTILNVTKRFSLKKKPEEIKLPIRLQITTSKL